MFQWLTELSCGCSYFWYCLVLKFSKGVTARTAKDGSFDACYLVGGRLEGSCQYVLPLTGTTWRVSFFPCIRASSSSCPLVSVPTSLAGKKMVAKGYTECKEKPIGLVKGSFQDLYKVNSSMFYWLEEVPDQTQEKCVTWGKLWDAQITWGHLWNLVIPGKCLCALHRNWVNAEQTICHTRGTPVRLPWTRMPRQAWKE